MGGGRVCVCGYRCVCMCVRVCMLLYRLTTSGVNGIGVARLHDLFLSFSLPMNSACLRFKPLVLLCVHS